MKQTFKGYYIIVNQQGKYLPHTIRVQKKSCIDNFIDGSSMTWPEIKKHGWKCVKVNIEISQTSITK